MTGRRRILVTSALPYANGSLHLGHILEAIQTDIWARFQRLRGNECMYICAIDAHGTPIMLKAAQLGIEPEQLVADYRNEQLHDYRGFGIAFDNYYTTHSEENRQLSERVFQLCQEGGYISSRPVVQAYDPVKKLFLADRYITGNCPRCKAAGQYGDNCESCGASYSPNDLINPRSVLSGEVPELRESQHCFFRLPEFKTLLQNWLQQPRLQPQVVAKLQEWMQAGLMEWDISRDAPYFGFRIPGTRNKYFYVWLDAPIGYIASCKQLCDRNGDDFMSWWGKNTETELHHFIGKDIINFHGLFWPALLAAANYRLPDAIYAHGFLTVNGHKMSKSKGTLIGASHYLNHLDGEYLRYYFAARLDAGVGDIDLNLDDFSHRVNADLIGKIINIPSRCAGFLSRHFDATLGQPDAPQLVARAEQLAPLIAELYENREYSRAVRTICSLADETNKYIDDKAPWVMARQNKSNPGIQAVCTTAISLFRLLALYLKPVIPATVGRAEVFLGEPLSWQNLIANPAGKKIAPFKPLLTRIEKEQLQGLAE